MGRHTYEELQKVAKEKFNTKNMEEVDYSKKYNKNNKPSVSSGNQRSDWSYVGIGGYKKDKCCNMDENYNLDDEQKDETDFND